MKITGFILAVLMLLGSVAIGVIGAGKAMDFVKVLEEIPAEVIEAGDLPSASLMKTGAIVGYLAGLAGLALLIVTFVKREKIPMVAAVAVGLCVISVVLYPGIEASDLGGMAPRTQAIVTTVLALLGAAGSFMAKKGSEKG